jgi:hypothetical protein
MSPTTDIRQAPDKNRRQVVTQYRPGSSATAKINGRHMPVSGACLAPEDLPASVSHASRVAVLTTGAISRQVDATRQAHIRRRPSVTMTVSPPDSTPEVVTSENNRRLPQRFLR